MAKQIDISDPFNQGISAEDADAQLYGAVQIGQQAKRDKIYQVAINLIKPDMMQPRRVVPSAVRQDSDGSPGNMLDTWFRMVEFERGSRLPLEKYIFSGETDRSNEDAEPETGELEASLLKLVDLAASIHRDGLSNPISVAPTENNQFVIETGERRWLAYHLLDTFLEGDAYNKIPCRKVEEISLWRQAAENNARDNLNAISRARQLAVLLMDVHGWDHFQPLTSFEYEQDFYAQVADGNEWRVPRDKGEQLVNAMGLKNTVQIRQYRNLLRATHDLWQHADDTDMPERQIRDIMSAPSVTKVTVRKPKEAKFNRMLERLENELSDKNWKRLSSQERRARYESLQMLVHRLEMWGID